jgi:hypothetical protein
MRITDTTGNRISYMAFDLSDGESSSVIVLRITPAAGFFLSASPGDADVEIQARETSSGDPFVDLATAPIDLASYTPETPVNFDLKVVAATPLTGVRRVVLFIAVTSSGAAGWTD